MQSSMHKNIHTGQAGIMRTITIYTLTGTSTYLAAAFTLKKKKKKSTCLIFLAYLAFSAK